MSKLKMWCALALSLLAALLLAGTALGEVSREGLVGSGFLRIRINIEEVLEHG